MLKSPLKLVAKTLGFLLIPAVFLYIGNGALAAVGLSVGHGSLNLGQTENLYYGNIGLSSHASSSFLLFQKNAGDIFKIDNFGNLTTSGAITAGAFSGPITGGSINAANVSAGSFGANLGGGNYSFPGNIAIGTSTFSGRLNVDGSMTTNGLVSKNTINISSSNNDQLRLGYASDTSYYYPYQSFTRSRGLLTAPTSVQAGDYIGATNFYGYNGSMNVGVAGFGAQVAGVNGSYLLGKLSFSVSAGVDAGSNFTAFDVTPSLTSFYTPTTYISGNLGIGTTNPGAKLEVAGDIKSTVSGASALFTAYNPGTNYPRALFKVGNSASDVNTGLMFAPEYTASGVTKPFSLEIYNNKLNADASARMVGLGVYSTYASIHSLGPNGNSAGLPLIFSTQTYFGNNPAIYISNAASQNVGIGTSTATYKLYVNGSGYFNQPVVVGTPTAASHAATKNYVDSTIATATSTITFWNTGSNNLWNLNTGNVGIGITNPETKLDVAGAIRTNNQLISTVAQGTAPLVVTSNTTVANFSADLLDGIQGSVYYKNDDVSMNTNPFGGRRLYINSINDAFFKADKRWNIVAKWYSNADDSELGTFTASQVSNLFDGNYDNYLSVPAGSYAKITITFPNEPGGFGPFYSDGNYYISNYYTYYPDATVTNLDTLSVYGNYASQGVGLFTYNFSDFLRGSGSLITKATNSRYQPSLVEFVIHANSTDVRLVTEIDVQFNRPANSEMPVVDKFRPNFLYEDLTFQNGGRINRIVLSPSGNSYFNYGNLGIGTTTPGTRLTVVGSGNYSIDAGNFRVGNIAAPVGALDAVNKSYLDSAISSATSSITLWGGNTTGNIWSLNSGNVGVGTTNPLVKFQLNGTGFRFGVGTANFTNRPTAANDVTDALELLAVSSSGNTDYRMYIEDDALDSLSVWGNSCGAGGGCNNIGSSTNVLTIKAGGQIGIGTSNPTSQLTVTGVAGADSISLGAGHFMMPSNGQLRFGNNNNFITGNSSSNYFAFWTNNGERLRIDGSGNIGINTTNPAARLDVVSGVVKQSGYHVSDAATDNLLINGDFEMGDKFGWIIAGTVVNGGYAGNYALQVTGAQQLESADYIPVDPGRDIFQLDAWVKKTVAGTTPGVIYFGYIAYNENKVAITTSPCGTYCYFAASGYTIPADGAWHKLSATTVGEGTSFPNFPVGTKYVRVLGLMNYSASSDSVTLLDHITLKRLSKSPLIAGGNFFDTNRTDQHQYSTIYTTNANNLILGAPAGGNIGIGITSPSNLLHISGGTDKGIQFTNTVNSYSYSILNTVPGVSNNGLSIKDNNTGFTRFALFPSGNISIGTTTGGNRLDVSGGNVILHDAVITSGTPKAAVTKEYLDSSFTAFQGINSFWMQNGSNLYASSTGWNLGIGTTNPTSKLNVVSNAADTHVILENINAATSSYVTYTLRNIAQQWQMGMHGDVSQFRIRNTTAGTYPFVINTSGNVGVGTTNPTSPLYVKQAGVSDMTLALENSGPSTSFSLINTAVGGRTWEVRSTGTGSSGGIGNFAIRDAGAAAWRMVINPDGNVGIGTTTPAAKLDVYGMANVGGLTARRIDTAENVVNIIQNPSASAAHLYSSGDGYLGWVAQDAAGLRRYAFESNPGSSGRNFNLYIYDSGGANGTWVQGWTKTGASINVPLTINNSNYVAGSVSVGTTTPPASRLSIAGGNVFVNDAVITSGTPKAAVTKEYLDSSLTAFNTENNLWRLNGSNLFASSTSWNIGIGTTNPYNKFEVDVNSNATLTPVIVLKGRTDDETGLYGPMLGFQTERTQGDTVKAGIAFLRSSGYGTGDLHFLVDSSIDASSVGLTDSKMVINRVGNVGIGLTNPSHKLEFVASTATSSGLSFGNDVAIYRTAAGKIRMTAENQTYNSYLDFDFGQSWQWGTTITGGGNGGNVIRFMPNVMIADDASLLIGNNSTELLRRDSSGGGGRYVLRLQTGVAGAFGSSGYIFINDNAHDRIPSASTTNPTLRIYSSDLATGPNDYLEFVHNQTDGVIKSGAGSLYLNGTDGLSLAVNSNEAVRINNIRNIGISTSSPQSKLAVVGGNIFVHDAAITSGTPKAAITKEYLDSSLGAFAATNNHWIQAGSNLYASSSNWNVGVGTVSPPEKLTVYSAAATPAFIRVSSPDNNISGIKFGEDQNSNQTYGHRIIYDGNGDYVKFQNIRNTVANDVMTFSSTGVVTLSNTLNLTTPTASQNGQNVLNLTMTSDPFYSKAIMGYDYDMLVNADKKYAIALGGGFTGQYAGNLFDGNTGSSIQTTVGNTGTIEINFGTMQHYFYGLSLNSPWGTGYAFSTSFLIEKYYDPSSANGWDGNCDNSEGDLVWAPIADVTGFSGSQYVTRNNLGNGNCAIRVTFRDISGSQNLVQVGDLSIYQFYYGYLGIHAKTTGDRLYGDYELSDGTLRAHLDNSTGHSYINGGSSANFGIGLSNPSAKLSVTGGNIFINDAAITSGTPKAAVTKEYLDSSLSAYTSANLWRLSGSNLLASTTTWNVGIGNNSPQTRLHVVNSGGNHSSGVLTGYGDLYLRNSNITGGNQGSTMVFASGYFNGSSAIEEQVAAIKGANDTWGNDGAGNLQFYTSAAGSAGQMYERMRISSTGLVGIGLTDPNSGLQLLSSTAASLNEGYSHVRLGYNGGAGAGSGGAQITFEQKYHDPDPAIIRVGAVRGIKTQGTGSFGGGVQLLYQPNANTDMVPALTLNHLGYVGMGTTNPSTQLDVIGVGTFGNMAGSRGAYGGTVNVQNNSAATTTLFMWQSGIASAHIGFAPNDSTLYLTNSFHSGAVTDPHSIAIKNDGNVGIGTSTPASKLDVSGGNISILDAVITSATPKVAVTKEYLDSALTSFNTVSNLWRLNSSDLFASSTNWNVGFGTTDPDHKFEIVASTSDRIVISNSAYDYSTSSPKLSFYGWSDPGIIAGPSIQKVGAYGNGAGRLSILQHNVGDYTNETEVFSVLPNGNIGIGTTNANKRLEIAGSVAGGAFEGLSINNETPYGLGVGTASARLNFNRTGSDAARMGYIEGGNTSENSSTDGYLAFATRQSNSLIERLRIANNGFVGIGTSNPGVALDIQGAGNKQLRIWSSDATSTATVRFLNNTMNYEAGIFSDTSFGINYGAIRGFTMNTSGNIGLGNTNPNVKLFVQTTADVYGVTIGDPANSQLRLAGTASGATGYGLIQQFTNGGLGYGNLVLQRDGGSVGIGTSTPAAKLSVSGGNIFINDTAITSGTPKAAVTKEYLDSSLGALNTTLWKLNGSSLYASSSSWNIGVGTNSPIGKLHIIASTTDRIIIGSNVDGNVNTDSPKLSFYGANTGDSAMIIGPSIQKINVSGGHGQGRLAIFQHIAGDYTNETEVLSILPNGSIGMGTSNPSSILHVYGGASTSRITLGRAGTPSMVGFMEYPAGVMQIGTAGSDGLNLQTANATRLSIGSSGGITIASGNNLGVDSGSLWVDATLNSVGIGTTVPRSPLHVDSSNRAINTTGNIFISTNDSLAADKGGQISFGGNWATGQPATIFGGIAGRKENATDGNAAGYLGLYTAVSNGGTMTEKMRITNSGDVLIGTTTTSSRLSISGGNTYINDAVITSGTPKAAITKEYFDSAVLNLWSGAKNGNIWNGDTGAGKVGIGTTDPKAKLHVAGGVVMNHTSVADVNYTLLDSDYVIGYSSITTNRTITLPNALCTPGRFFVVLDESGNAASTRAIIIDPEGTTPIIGVPTFNLTKPYNSVYIFCGNNAWYIL